MPLFLRRETNNSYWQFHRSPMRHFNAYGTILSMPNTTRKYKFGDVVLVPFRYTDINVHKDRPAAVISTVSYNAEALVISSDAYNNNSIEMIVVIGITGTPDAGELGSIPIRKWQEAGLRRESRIKPVIQTISQGRVIQFLGTLSTTDKNRLRMMLISIISLTKEQP